MSGFEKDLSIGTTMRKSQCSQGGFIQMFGKPTNVLILTSFKAAPLLFYSFANFFTSSFIAQFLVIVTLLSMDFWIVKNIRLLIGLQWWNFVDDDGKNHWKFKSSENMTQFPVVDRRVFWIGLVVGPAAWTVFVVTALLSLKFEWMIVALLGALINLAHLSGYLSCHWNHTENREQTTKDDTNTTNSHEACKLKLKTTMLQDRRIMFACIKYDVLQENPVEYAFNNFCRAFGNYIMKYNDFDFWYYRIRDGHFDLNYDRSKDRVLPGLSKMPPEIVLKIIGNLERKDRSVVRNVSRKLQTIVDNSKQYFNRITLDIDENSCFLSIDKQSHYCRFNDDRRNPEDNEAEISTNTTWEPALNRMLRILKLPKVEIKELNISFDNGDPDRFFDLIKEALSSLKYKISVQDLYLEAESPDEVFAVIPYLKSGLLKYITIGGRNIATRLNIDMLSELEQWKRAVVSRSGFSTCSHIEKLFNMSCFDAEIPTLTKDGFIGLREALRTSSKFRYGRVTPVDVVSVETVRTELGMDHESTEDGFIVRFMDGYVRFENTRNHRN